MKRDCEAFGVPSGERTTLPKETFVRITQSLGGNFTVVTDYGAMFSIPAKDADALGLEAPAPPTSVPPEAAAPSVEEGVWNQLRKCYDPEIPHNIVDLGLVYECRVSSLEGGGHKAEIKMSLTAPGCGMGDWLKQDVIQKVSSVPGIKEVLVNVVFDPPWDPSKMNPTIRTYLNL